jgi:hypothetical protein
MSSSQSDPLCSELVTSQLHHSTIKLSVSAQTVDDPLKVAVQHLKDETYNPNDDVLKVGAL